MHNTGNWDSDLAIIFFACLLLPIAWYYFVAAVESINAQTTAKPTPKPKTYKRYQPRANNVSPSTTRWIHPALTSLMPEQSRPKSVAKPPTKRVSKANHKPRPKPVKKQVVSLTDDTIQKEAIFAMCNLGFRKSDISKIVKDLCSKNKYESTESLIKECFVCIP